MSEMVKQVAKAIQTKCKERGYPECPAPLVHHIAAAAIEAMREPTEEMAEAGLDANPRGPSVYPDYDAKDIWRAMIDAATEKGGGRNRPQ